MGSGNIPIPTYIYYIQLNKLYIILMKNKNWIGVILFNS